MYLMYIYKGICVCTCMYEGMQSLDISMGVLCVCVCVCV